MREIKFRAKATQDYDTNIDGVEKGDWVYGYYYFCRNREIGIIVTDLSAESGGLGSGIVQVEIEVDCKTLGQFTGLSDKTAKEIYKGDILESSSFSYPFIVEYSEKLITFIAKQKKGSKTMYMLNEINDREENDNWDTERKIEVIGDIHEDKNLLDNK